MGKIEGLVKKKKKINCISQITLHFQHAHTFMRMHPTTCSPSVVLQLLPPRGRGLLQSRRAVRRGALDDRTRMASLNSLNIPRGVKCVIRFRALGIKINWRRCAIL